MTTTTDIAELVQDVSKSLPADHPLRVHLTRHVEIKGDNIRVVKADPSCPHCLRSPARTEA